MKHAENSTGVSALQQLADAIDSQREFDLQPVVAELRQWADDTHGRPVVPDLCRACSVLLELVASKEDDAADSEMLMFVVENADVLMEAVNDDSLALEMIEEIHDEVRERWGSVLDPLLEDLADDHETDLLVESAPDDLNFDDELDELESLELQEMDEMEALLAEASILGADEGGEVDGLTGDSTGGDSAGSATNPDPSPPIDAGLLQQALTEMALQHENDEAVEPGSRAAQAAPADTGQEEHADDNVVLSPELLEAFLDDAERCLGGLEQAAMELEGQGASPSVLNRLGRELHTIKGAAACVGLDRIADLTHRAEELLQGDDVSQMLQSIDEVTRRVEAVRDGGDCSAPASTSASAPGQTGSDGANSLANTRETSLANQTSPQPAEPASQQERPAAKTDASVSPVAESTQRIRTSQLDRLMDMLAELVMLRNRRHTSVDQLTGIHGDLMRSVEHFKRLTGKFAQTIDGLVTDDLAGCEATLGSLSEVADDLSHSLRNLRGIYEPLAEDNEQVSQFIGQFRHELAALRRMPVAGLFHKLRRVARETARAEDKEVQLHFVGEDFGIEPAVQERLYEPLLHIMRNSISHGIEIPDQRLSIGKPRAGQVTLEAAGSAHLVHLEIRDDGRGLDYEAIRRRGIERKLLSPDRPVSREELAQLIFHPGFSTKDNVSQVSGRGVGMDVVAQTLEQMRGWIDVSSTQGKGTVVRISLPLPSVIQHMMVFRSGGQLFGVPMQSLDFAGAQQNARGVTDSRAILNRPLGKPLGAESDLPMEGDMEKAEILWVHSNARLNADASVNLDDDQELVMQTVGAVLSRAAPMRVDEILGPEEAVVRPLPPLLRHHPLVSGLSLSGTGEVVQLLDSHSLALHLEQYQDIVAQGPRQSRLTQRPQSETGPAMADPDCPAVLVVDDSKTARLRIAKPIADWGVEVCQAGDGAEALELLKQRPFAAIFTDLEMPVMDGFELLYELQSRNTLEPVIVASTLQHETHRKRTAALGAAEHLGKPVDKALLYDTLRRLAPALRLRDSDAVQGTQHTTKATTAEPANGSPPS